MGFAMLSWLVTRLMRAVYRGVVAGRPRRALALAAPSVVFEFPGDNSFAGVYHGRAELAAWLRRFSALGPQFTVHDALVGGPPWNMRVAVRFTDAIGAHYRNDGIEYLRLRWGRVRRLQIFLDTERIHEWEQREPWVRDGQDSTDRAAS